MTKFNDTIAVIEQLPVTYGELKTLTADTLVINDNDEVEVVAVRKNPGGAIRAMKGMASVINYLLDELEAVLKRDKGADK